MSYCSGPFLYQIFHIIPISDNITQPFYIFQQKINWVEFILFHYSTFNLKFWNIEISGKYLQFGSTDFSSIPHSFYYLSLSIQNMERGTQQGAMKKVVVNYLFTNTLNWILIFLHGRTKWWGMHSRPDPQKM